MYSDGQAKTNCREKMLRRRRKKCDEGVTRRGWINFYTLAPSESSLHANGFIHKRIQSTFTWNSITFLQPSSDWSFFVTNNTSFQSEFSHVNNLHQFQFKILEHLHFVVLKEINYLETRKVNIKLETQINITRETISNTYYHPLENIYVFSSWNSYTVIKFTFQRVKFYNSHNIWFDFYKLVMFSMS